MCLCKGTILAVAIDRLHGMPSCDTQEALAPNKGVPQAQWLFLTKRTLDAHSDASRCMIAKTQVRTEMQ